MLRLLLENEFSGNTLLENEFSGNTLLENTFSENALLKISGYFERLPGNNMPRLCGKGFHIFYKYCLFDIA